MAYHSVSHPMTTRDSLIKIMTLVIANAETPAIQKEMIMVAHENRLISYARAADMIAFYGLRAA